MRLTNEVKYKDNYINEHFPQYDVNLQDNCDIKTRLMQITNKLGKLEDVVENHNIETLEELDCLLSYVKQIKCIEKEIGIDLITLFNALKQQYVFRIDERIYEDSFQVKTISTIRELRYVFYGAYGEYNLKDYGKTWALTKEELE